MKPFLNFLRNPPWGAVSACGALLSLLATAFATEFTTFFWPSLAAIVSFFVVQSLIPRRRYIALARLIAFGWLASRAMPEISFDLPVVGIAFDSLASTPWSFDLAAFGCISCALILDFLARAPNS